MSHHQRGFWGNIFGWNTADIQSNRTHFMIEWLLNEGDILTSTCLVYFHFSWSFPAFPEKLPDRPERNRVCLGSADRKKCFANLENVSHFLDAVVHFGLWEIKRNGFVLFLSLVSLSDCSQFVFLTVRDENLNMNMNMNMTEWTSSMSSSS